MGNVGQANYAAAKLGIVGLTKVTALDMARYNVTANCISPFAWTRMIGTIPTETEAQKTRVEKQQCSPGCTGRFVCEQSGDHAKHKDEHRYGQERSNLAEAASHVMSGEHHQITGYVRSKESSERKKSDNVDCTCCRAQDNWQQPIRCSDFHQLACAT